MLRELDNVKVWLSQVKLFIFPCDQEEAGAVTERKGGTEARDKAHRNKQASKKETKTSSSLIVCLELNFIKIILYVYKTYTNISSHIKLQIFSYLPHRIYPCLAMVYR